MAHQRFALEVEGVECQVGGRDLITHGRAAGQPLAQPRIVGAPVVVGRDHLAVDDAARRDAPGRRRDLWQVGGQVVEAAILQPNLAVRVAKHHAPKPIPFHFEDVFG